MAYIDGSLYDTNDIRGHEIPPRDIRYHINGAWLTITINRVVVFKRAPINGDWMDEKHKAIYNAILTFEQALMDAIP